MRARTPHWDPQLLRPTLGKRAPKTSNFENPGVCVPTRTRLWPSEKPPHWDSPVQAQLRPSHWRRIKVRGAHLLVLTCTHIQEPAGTPRDGERGHHLHLSLLRAQRPDSPGREPYNVWCPDFCSCRLRDASCSPGSRGQRACIPGLVGV